MTAYALEFTEEMKGFFTLGESDFERGESTGRDDGTAIMFHLTIATDDVDRFIADKDHVATAEGWVKSDVLGGKLPVERGVFNLFVEQGPHHKRMLYRLWFADGVGRPLTLSGFKEIDPGDLTQLWPETSTLYTKVLRGHVEAEEEETAELVGAGVIHILKRDFAKQLTTFRVHGPALAGRWRAFRDFSALFGLALWDVYNPFRRRPKAQAHV